MLLGAVAFASMGALAHALKDHCDWRVIAVARSTIPLLLSAGLARAAGVRLVFWRPATLWVRSLAGSLSLICTFYAFTRLPVSDVLTITNLFPIWVAVLSWPMLNQPPGRDVWIAVSLGVVGVFLIQQPHLAEGNFAALVALTASFTSAFALINLHRLQGLDARMIVFHFSAVALGVCLLLCLLPFGALQFPEFNARNIALLLGVGASATCGQLCLTIAFATGSPAKVSVVGLTQVAFGIAFDALLWGRSFGLLTICGTLCVLAPAGWLMFDRARREGRRMEAVGSE